MESPLATVRVVPDGTVTTLSAGLPPPEPDDDEDDGLTFEPPPPPPHADNPSANTTANATARGRTPCFVSNMDFPFPLTQGRPSTASSQCTTRKPREIPLAGNDAGAAAACHYPAHYPTVPLPNRHQVCDTPRHSCFKLPDRRPHIVRRGATRRAASVDGHDHHVSPPRPARNAIPVSAVLPSASCNNTGREQPRKQSVNHPRQSEEMHSGHRPGFTANPPGQDEGR